LTLIEDDADSLLTCHTAMFVSFFKGVAFQISPEYSALISQDIDRSLEVAYISSKFGMKLPTGYWSKKLVSILSNVFHRSNTPSQIRIYLYELTHIVFYGTDFGKSKPDIFTFPSLPCILKGLFEQLFSQEEWDISVEILLALEFLRKSHGHAFDETIIHGKCLFQSTEGAIISEGSKFPEIPTESQEYSLYHTTILALVWHAVRASGSS
jgi:hypothetical protein